MHFIDHIVGIMNIKELTVNMCETTTTQLIYGEKKLNGVVENEWKLNMKNKYIYVYIEYHIKFYPHPDKIFNNQNSIQNPIHIMVKQKYLVE